MKCNKEFTSSERSLGGTLHQVSKAVWVQGQMNAFATEATERITGEVGMFLRDVRKSVRKQEGGQKKNATGDGGVRYRIVTAEGENGVHENCVLLDTQSFDKVKPRYWGKIVSDCVYNNLAGIETFCI